MTIRKAIRSQSLNLLLNSTAVRRRISEAKRRIGGNVHAVTAFLELDDPYSYLLAHYLPALTSRFDIELTMRLTQAAGEEFRPMKEMLAEYAQKDCRMLARELGLPFLDLSDTPVVEHRRALLEVLVAAQGTDEFEELLLHVMSVYWRGDSASVARLITGTRSSRSEANALQESNLALLQRLGHYNTATLHYAGEWYWGVDRMHYLVDRLDSLGLRKDQHGDDGDEIAAVRQVSRVNLPMTAPASTSSLPALEMFHSFRSPYCYLALERFGRIADAYGLRFQIKPVLPMVMRGLPVPKAKLLYIVRDCKREADRLGIPFGRISDPVGPGAERCIAVFAYAQSQQKERQFCIEAGKAIFSEAVDVASDKGMRIVTERAGLFWPEVKAAMYRDDWREEVQVNRDTMTEAGVWGVPSFRLGELCLWGQDRDWILARQIEDKCHSGDGILK